MNLSPPTDAIELRFIRAGGPGGQNADKGASAGQLRCDLQAWPELRERGQERLRRRAGRRPTGDGVAVVAAHRFRTQEHNKRDALERLSALAEEARIEPKIRRATKPTRASKEKRLQTKTQRSTIRRTRGRVRDSD